LRLVGIRSTGYRFVVKKSFNTSAATAATSEAQWAQIPGSIVA